MGLPGHRRTSGDKRRNATHFALKPGALSHCPKCEKATLPHHACAFCGTYKGREVLNTKRKEHRATKKAGKK